MSDFGGDDLAAVATRHPEVPTLRTILYGIPLLAIGVLAALPFRRDPAAAIETPAAEHSFPLETSAMVELPSAPQSVWTPSPRDIAHPAIPSTTFPALPEDYAKVAVPLATPPAIAERFSAVQPDPWSPGSTSAVPAGSTVAASPQPLSRWQMDLPIEASPLPNDRPHNPQLEAIATDRSSSDSAAAEEARATPALAVGFPNVDQHTPRESTPEVAEETEASMANADPAPRKRYFIREPVR